MTSALFREAARAFRAALAREMGCAPEAYESHALTVVERPSNSREPHLALATTCGTGSVLSVRDRELAAWALKEELAHHFRIFLPSFLEGLAAEARELGHANAKSHTASTGMVLAEAVDPGTLPPGYSVRDLSVDEQERLRAGKVFDNALLEPAEKKVEYFRTAFAAFDPGAEVAAVAGVWDQ